jgi:hypothetical protein
MSDYWTGLMEYKKTDSVFDIRILDVREQIQEDIMTYMNPLLDNDYEFTNLNVDDLCQIVVDNFKKLEKK